MTQHVMVCWKSEDVCKWGRIAQKVEMLVNVTTWIAQFADQTRAFMHLYGTMGGTKIQRLPGIFENFLQIPEKLQNLPHYSISDSGHPGIRGRICILENLVSFEYPFHLLVYLFSFPFGRHDNNSHIFIKIFFISHNSYLIMSTIDWEIIFYII